MFDFLKRKNSENSLAEVIVKGEKSGYGAFLDLNNDLAAFFEEVKDYDPLILMTNAYARRVVTAGMVLQGIVEKSQFDYVGTVFKATQVRTIHTVEFQEEAYDEAVKLIHSYTSLFDKTALSLIVSLVQDGNALTPPEGETLDIETIAVLVNSAKQKLT
jgi:hypothetical protein